MKVRPTPQQPRGSARRHDPPTTPIEQLAAREPAPKPKGKSLLWRYRWQLAPLGMAGAVYADAALLAAHPPTGGILLAGGATLGGVWLWRAKLRAEELLYGRLALTAGITWPVLAALVGPTSIEALGTWVVLTAAGAVPWWKHRRIRGRVRVDRTIEAWPDWTARAGHPGVRAVHGTAGRAVDRIRLELQRGRQKAAGLVTDVESYASVRGIPLWRIRFDTQITRTDPGLVDLLITHDDPWRNEHGVPVDLPHPAVADPAAWCADRTIRQPAPYGVDDTGGTADVRLWTKIGGRLIVVVAKKGAGKTVLLGDLAAAAMPMVDARVSWIDHKEKGKASRAFALGLYRRATTPAQAVDLLKQFIADGNAAGASSPDPVLQPTTDTPAEVLIIDEYGALCDAEPQIAELVENAARTLRSASRTLIVADQHVDATHWSGALRGQLDEVIVGRMQSARAVRQIMPGPLEVNPADFDEDMHGQVAQRAGTAGTVHVRRAWHLEDVHDIARIVAECPQRQAPADEDEGMDPETTQEITPNAAAVAATRSKVAQAAEAVADMATGPRPANMTAAQMRAHAQSQPAPTPTPEDDALDARIVAALTAAGPGGVAMGDLVDVTGAKRSTVQIRCSSLRRAGRAILDPPKGAHARWKLTGCDQLANA